jgi:hypothetical protein
MAQVFEFHHKTYHPRTTAHSTLWIQKAQNGLLILFAQSCAHAHMSRNRYIDAWRKSGWRIVAPRAILLKHLLAIRLLSDTHWIAFRLPLMSTGRCRFGTCLRKRWYCGQQ